MQQDLTVEVAYAKPERQWLIETKVPPQSSIVDAIRHSGILDLCPELVAEQLVVGIFGKLRLLTHPLQNGDRVEIYRPLLKDPREARRERHQENGISHRHRFQTPQRHR